MKRNICLFLAALVLLTSLCGCSKPSDEAVEMHARYTAAKELYESGFEAIVSFKTTVGDKSAEGSFNVKVAGDDASIKRDDSNDERHYVKGMAYRRGYIHGGVYYEDNDAQLAKVCESVTRDAFKTECASFFCINPYASDFPTLTEEALADAEFTEAGGYSAFAVSLSADAVKAYFADETIEGAEGVMVATFDSKGDMVSLGFRFDVSWHDSDVQLFEITYEFKNIGFVPAIMAPENAEEYTEL